MVAPRKYLRQAGQSSADPFLPSTLTVTDGSDRYGDPRFRGDPAGERYLWKESVEPSATSYKRTTRNLNVTEGTRFDPAYQPMEPLAGGASAENWTFTRIEPQSVRDPEYQNPDRADENPDRNRWTMKWSQYDAPSGTVRPDTVYSPQITAYAPRPYGSYGEIVGGQTQYYVSDTDPYRGPLYQDRARVYSVDFRDPMGGIQPEYHRIPLADPYEGNSDVAQGLNDLSEECSWREDLMERQSRGLNGREWKYRAAQ